MSAPAGLTRLDLPEAVLGEGPWWDPRDDSLVYVDIVTNRVLRGDLDGAAREYVLDRETGFACGTDDGRLLVGVRDGLRLLDERDGSVSPVWAGVPDPDRRRVNDGKTDRRGRVWFGTMHDAETEASSRLYRLGDQGPVSVLDGITTSNGLGWSPAGDTFYYTDSMARTIWAFDHDPDEGRLGERRVFAQDPDAYRPDGLTVDAEGCVWSAKWNGARLVRYTPDGTVDRTVGLPVRRPTSVVFGGHDLDLLVITSARLDGDLDGETAGSVFVLDVGVGGLPETPVDTRLAGIAVSSNNLKETT